MKDQITISKKKLIVAIIVIFVMIGSAILAGCTGCATWQRECKSCESEFAGGLNREVNVYSYDGKLLAHYEGRIDIEENESKVLFELDGKRYIYYNALVEVIEK